MHNDYVREDGQWPPESVPTARDWALFDRAQSRIIRIDSGRQYSPSTPIVLGGSGVEIVGAGNLVSGDVRTESGGRLVLGDDDYPEFATPRSRTLAVPLVLGAHSISGGTSDVYSLGMSLDPMGLQFLTPEGSAAQVLFTIPEEFLHHGATLESVDFHMRVTKPHGALPTTLPNVAMARFPIGAVSGGAYLNGGLGGTLSPVPTTGDAYFASGAPQTIALPTPNNHVIDVSAYRYTALIIDEDGAGLGPSMNVWHAIVLHYTTIADARHS